MSALVRGDPSVGTQIQRVVNSDPHDARPHPNGGAIGTDASSCVAQPMLVPVPPKAVE